MIDIEFLGHVISFDPSALLGPGMFLALVVALLSGYPVAFCLGGIAVIFALLGIALGEFDPLFVTALPTDPGDHGQLHLAGHSRLCIHGRHA